MGRGRICCQADQAWLWGIAAGRPVCIAGYGQSGFPCCFCQRDLACRRMRLLTVSVSAYPAICLTAPCLNATPDLGSRLLLRLAAVDAARTRLSLETRRGHIALRR